MYETGEAALERIVELVAKCPKELQEKCFEVLLSGYVELEVAGLKPPSEEKRPSGPLPLPPAESHVPAAVLPRFKNTAKRLEVSLEKLESLFDFAVDPFTLHPITLPGNKNSEKSRNLVLLAAAHSYLATGVWSADWQEVKSLCVNYNCYDGPNHLVNLRQGVGTIFKAVESGDAIVLSAGGVKKAEDLLKSVAAGASE